MGNDMGRSANRMAIGAMANATHFEKKELLRLQHKFMELAQREGNPFTITRAEFREALELVGIMESDTEILERLFSMFDKTGNDQINYREFVGGLAPLCHGSVEDKLAFSFELCDHNQTGKIQQDDMEQVLISINETASYFGDPVLKRAQVKELVLDIFGEYGDRTGSLDYANYVKAVADHPVVVQFATGEGTERYGSGN
eukprot:g8693.t1